MLARSLLAPEQFLIVKRSCELTAIEITPYVLCTTRRTQGMGCVRELRKGDKGWQAKVVREGIII
jgi:hypothetical protein